MFEFEVTRYVISRDEIDYDVHLPHKCDDWKITSDNQYDAQPDKAEAVRRMKQFIAEAQEALSKLEALE